jgi:hypothetical protein
LNIWWLAPGCYSKCNISPTRTRAFRKTIRVLDIPVMMLTINSEGLQQRGMQRRSCRLGHCAKMLGHIFQKLLPDLLLVREVGWFKVSRALHATSCNHYALWIWYLGVLFVVWSSYGFKLRPD